MMQYRKRSRFMHDASLKCTRLPAAAAERLHLLNDGRHRLLRRLQAVIDRCFYRRKYDTPARLVAFSATLRDEVDLTALIHALVDVVEETMQPSHVSLWIRLPRQQQP